MSGGYFIDTFGKDIAHLQSGDRIHVNVPTIDIDGVVALNGGYKIYTTAGAFTGVRINLIDDSINQRQSAFIFKYDGEYFRYIGQIIVRENMDIVGDAFYIIMVVNLGRGDGYHVLLADKEIRAGGLEYIIFNPDGTSNLGLTAALVPVSDQVFISDV